MCEIVADFEDVSVADFAEGVTAVIAINDKTYFIFLRGVSVTELGWGCTMKIFWRTKDIYSTRFLDFVYIREQQ